MSAPSGIRPTLDERADEDSSLERALGASRRSRKVRGERRRTRDEPAIASIVRREVFARTGPLATRYGITPERVVHRVTDRCNGVGGLRAARMVANIEDIMHAMACLDGHPFAWLDLRDLHEGSLIRVCAARIGDGAANMLVRRWLDSLRARCGQAAVDTPSAERGLANAFVRREGASRAGASRVLPGRGEQTVGVTSAAGGRLGVVVETLDAYVGTTPLRHWLAQQLLGPLAVTDEPDAPLATLPLAAP